VWGGGRLKASMGADEEHTHDNEAGSGLGKTIQATKKGAKMPTVNEGRTVLTLEEECRGANDAT